MRGELSSRSLPDAYHQYLSLDNARRRLLARLKWYGTDTLQLGALWDGPEETIVADILDRSGTVVLKAVIDRRNGDLRWRIFHQTVTARSASTRTVVVKKAA